LPLNQLSFKDLAILYCTGSLLFTILIKFAGYRYRRVNIKSYILMVFYHMGKRCFGEQAIRADRKQAA